MDAPRLKVWVRNEPASGAPSEHNALWGPADAIRRRAGEASPHKEIRYRRESKIAGYENGIPRYIAGVAESWPHDNGARADRLWG